MYRKGLAAMLDGLLAFSIAFIAVGMMAVLLSDTSEEDIKTTYTLNLWAEDIADVVGMSFNDQNLVPPAYKAWFDPTHDAFIRPTTDDLGDSLTNLSETLHISIRVNIEGLPTPFKDIGNLDTAEEIATARRLLLGFTLEDPDYLCP
jgi:hypothetical protein